ILTHDYSSQRPFSFFTRTATPRQLHSFPTRRSSDLGVRRGTSARARDRASHRHSDRSYRECIGIGDDEGRLSPVSASHGIRRPRSEEHTSELQSRENLVCRLLLEKKKKSAVEVNLGE